MLVTMSSITMNNYWNYQKTANFHSTLPLSKIMERIIKNRLEFIVERKKLLKPGQCGFRKAQLTTDILLRLEHRIRQAFENQNVSLVVYLDLKSAFDKILEKGVIYKLSIYGLQGNI